MNTQESYFFDDNINIDNIINILEKLKKIKDSKEIYSILSNSNELILLLNKINKIPIYKVAYDNLLNNYSCDFIKKGYSSFLEDPIFLRILTDELINCAAKNINSGYNLINAEKNKQLLDSYMGFYVYVDENETDVIFDIILYFYDFKNILQYEKFYEFNIREEFQYLLLK